MRILAAVLVIAVFFILGQFRFLQIYGTNPNLLFVALLFFAIKALRFRFLGVLLAVSAVLAILFTPAWLIQISGLLLVVLFFYFAKDFMTGSQFLDFLIGITAGTFLFYLVVSPFRFDPSFYTLILWEALYNLIIGTILWYAVQKVTT